MKQLRILLVEDDPVIGLLLAELLVGLGHSVCATVGTEPDAVAAAARHAPDLMVVDVHLAEGSGISAMGTIGRTRAMAHVFMTGALPNSLPVTTTVLHKPFFERDLVRALAEAWDATSSPPPAPARIN